MPGLFVLLEVHGSSIGKYYLRSDAGFSCEALFFQCFMQTRSPAKRNGSSQQIHFRLAENVLHHHQDPAQYTAREGSAHILIIAFQWEACRRRFVGLLHHALIAPCTLSFLKYCERPPTSPCRTATSGRLGTLKFCLLDRCCIRRVCLPPGTLGLCMQRALPAHRQIDFPACEMEKDVIASCPFQ